jgi:hypothetical protein
LFFRSRLAQNVANATWSAAMTHGVPSGFGLKKGEYPNLSVRGVLLIGARFIESQASAASFFTSFFTSSASIFTFTDAFVEGHGLFEIATVRPRVLSACATTGSRAIFSKTLFR